MAPKKNGKTKALPTGYTEMSSTLAGFFHRVPDNAIEGKYRGSFRVKGRYGEKSVHRIEVTSGDCVIADKEGESVAEVGEIVGLDETGYLKRLAGLEDGTQVYVRCVSKGPEQKDPWVFQLGIKQ